MGKGQLARTSISALSVNSNKHEGQAAYDALTEKLYLHAHGMMKKGYA